MRPPRGRDAGLVLAVLAFAPAGPALAQAPQAHEVKLWIRAFIPDSQPKVPGYIKTAGNGRKVLEAPWVPALGDLGGLKGTCFTTDDRGFSLDPAASARAAVALVITVQGRDLKVTQSQVRIGETHNVDCKTGADLRPPRRGGADQARVGPVMTAGFLKTVNVRIGAANPFFTLAGVSVAPNIDMEAVLQYDGLSRDLKVFGTAGYFPAFEVLYSKDGGPVTALTQLPIYGASTAVNLFDAGTGVNTRNHAGALDLSE